MILHACQRLPIPKRMRWGNSNAEFVRPVQWVIVLLGSEVVPCTILDQEAGNQTRGHRYHHPQPITISEPKQYEKLLAEQGKVIANFSTRRKIIEDRVNSLATEVNGQVVIEPKLLDEVCGMVEWPVPMRGHFAKTFLQVPQEALISAMAHHQKCFHLVDKQQQLLPYFITVCNIESNDPQQVLAGNERVMTARLADAQFFYETDLKTPLGDFQQRLSHVIFKEKLGTMADKTQRIASLAGLIADELQWNKEFIIQAAQLAKADLMTDMVGEFPELQGIMGYYYGCKQGYPEPVAIALRDHYLPRFSGDKLPDSEISAALAIADRLDTIIGLFSINQPPSGEKDPFALRRAALGLLRIIIEKNLNLNLLQLIHHGAQSYSMEHPTAVEDCFQFILDRLKTWYLEQGISQDVFAAVMAKKPTHPLDFQQRIDAVNQFRTLPEASALAAANKRVSKLLSKEGKLDIDRQLHHEFFESDIEANLAKLIASKQQQVIPLYQQASYTDALSQLASLRKPVDDFFDQVMVMVDDPNVRNNRLALLANLRDLFLEVADISVLQ